MDKTTDSIFHSISQDYFQPSENYKATKSLELGIPNNN